MTLGQSFPTRCCLQACSGLSCLCKLLNDEEAAPEKCSSRLHTFWVHIQAVDGRPRHHAVHHGVERLQYVHRQWIGRSLGLLLLLVSCLVCLHSRTWEAKQSCTSLFLMAPRLNRMTLRMMTTENMNIGNTSATAILHHQTTAVLMAPHPPVWRQDLQSRAVRHNVAPAEHLRVALSGEHIHKEVCP